MNCTSRFRVAIQIRLDETHKEEKPTEENGAVQWQLIYIYALKMNSMRSPEQGLAGGVVFTFFSMTSFPKSYRNWSEPVPGIRSFPA